MCQKDTFSEGVNRKSKGGVVFREREEFSESFSRLGNTQIVERSSKKNAAVSICGNVTPMNQDLGSIRNVHYLKRFTETI